MNCFCRTVYRTIFTQRLNTSLGASVKLPVSSHPVRCSSSKNQVMFFEDKNISLKASLDMKKGENIYKKARDKIYFNKYIEKCFSNDFSPSYVVSSIRALCSECGCSAELVSSLLVSIFDFQKENNIQLEFTVDQKQEVMKHLIKHKYLGIVHLACSLFKINKEPHWVKEIVDELIQSEDYFKAAYFIGALNLQKEYDLEKILIPLLLNGNISPVVSCLSGFPDLQLQIGQILDTLMDKNAKSYRSISAKSKTVYKSLSSIVNIFKIPPENFKNLHFIRSRAAINMLVKKKSQQSITESTWEDMVMAVISKNPELQKHLIKRLVASKDIDTAKKMVSKLDMKDFDLLSLIESMKDIPLPPTATSEIDDEEIDDNSNAREPDVLELDLDSSCVHFIDTKEKFLKCIDDITQNYTLIGIDSEWRPNFGLAEERLSLVQLAVHDKVYVLDMISLNEALQNELWDTLIDEVFASPKIVKLGCDIMSDVQMIVESNKGNNGKTMRFSHTLDMAIFYRKLQDTYPDKFSMDEGDNPKNRLGLSRLCKMLLGKSLNKEERLCDWEKRPLTETQLQYAALDAYCLLQVYDALKEISLENDMKFEHLAKVSIVLTSSQSKTRKRSKRRNKQFSSGDSFLIQKPIPIQKFKVLIDSKLDFLGNQLRQFGADVLILKHTDTEETAIQIANSEERLLICSKSLWNIVQNKVSGGFCVDTLDDAEEVTASHIIQRFNVLLSTKHMPSNCLVCQSEQVVRLSRENLDFLQKWASNSITINEKDLEMNSFHKSILELSNSGIDIKLNKDDSSGLSTTLKHICLKCGVFQ